MGKEALQEPGNHGVTNAIFYGAPGIEATTVEQLGVKSGHVFTMETPDDPIQWVYDAPRPVEATGVARAKSMSLRDLGRTIRETQCAAVASIARDVKSIQEQVAEMPYIEAAIEHAQSSGRGDAGSSTGRPTRVSRQ